MENEVSVEDFFSKYEQIHNFLEILFTSTKEIPIAVLGIIYSIRSKDFDENWGNCLMKSQIYNIL